MTKEDIARLIIEDERYNLSDNPIQKGAELIEKYKAAAIKEAKREWYQKLYAKLEKILDGEMSIIDYMEKVKGKFTQPCYNCQGCGCPVCNGSGELNI